jgi:hypothetical protein
VNRNFLEGKKNLREIKFCGENSTNMIVYNKVVNMFKEAIVTNETKKQEAETQCLGHQGSQNFSKKHICS